MRRSIHRLAESIPALAVLTALCLAFPLATAAQAQEPEQEQATSGPTKESILARGPLFTLQLAGPKAMRQAVLPTNLGALISSPECKPVRDLWQMALQGILAEARTEDAREAWTVLQDRLLGYAGRLDLGFHITEREVRNKQWVRYHMGGHILLWPDGSTDMAKLAQEARAFLVAMSGEAPITTDLEDGRQCEFFGRPNDDGITCPMKLGKEGEALVLFFGSRIDKAISGGMRRLATSSQAHAERNKAWRKSVGVLAHLDVDMVQVAALIDDEFRRHRERASLVHKLFGTESWQWARSSIRTAGPQILIEATMDYEPGKDRGIFDAFLPDITTLPKLAAMAPHGTEEKPQAFTACHIRLGKLYNLFLEFMGNLFRHQPRSLAEIKAEVKKEMGFDLEADLLAHLSTEVLELVQIDDDTERDRRGPDCNGLCLVTRIGNPEGFAAIYKKLKAHPELRPGEPQEIEGGEAVPLPEGIFMGRTKKLFFFAFGDRGLEAMKAFLRHNKDQDDPRGLPKVVQRASRSTPPGWNAAGVLPSRWLRDPMMAEVLWEIWKEIDEVFPREVRRSMTREMLIQNAARMDPILKKYRLDRMVLLGGWEPRAAGAPDSSRARLRLLW